MGRHKKSDPSRQDDPVELPGEPQSAALAAGALFDPATLTTTTPPSASLSGSVSKDGLKALTLPHLLRLRNWINELLPATSIQELDLEEELLLQYHLARALVDEVSSENNFAVPANQKAQVMNSAAAILKTLADAQRAMYDAERVKAIEASVVRAFRDQPAAIRNAFLERYESILREKISNKASKKQTFLSKTS